MKTIIAFIAICVAIASAIPVTPISQTVTPAPAQILAYQNDNIGVGPYNFAFQSSDGVKREEHSQVVLVNDEPEHIVSGSYSYFGPDNVEYTVTYTADKNGFHPSGAHIAQ